MRRCEFPLGTHKLKVVLTVWDSTQGLAVESCADCKTAHRAWQLKVVLTVWDSTQGLAVDKGTRLGEEEERNEDNYSDCAVGMHRGHSRRLHNIQKC